jgi:hypothetical protein
LRSRPNSTRSLARRCADKCRCRPRRRSAAGGFLRGASGADSGDHRRQKEGGGGADAIGIPALARPASLCTRGESHRHYPPAPTLAGAPCGRRRAAWSAQSSAVPWSSKFGFCPLPDRAPPLSNTSYSEVRSRLAPSDRSIRAPSPRQAEPCMQARIVGCVAARRSIIAPAFLVCE